MSIHLHNIAKHFGNTQALEPINLDIHDGELVGLLGPSGSGKTTLLRIIAGLESADHSAQPGKILFGNRDVTNVHVRDRRIGFVFQHYALFRHMSVYDNVAFGLTVQSRKRRPSSGEIRARVFRLLEMVKLEHLANRYPAQLPAASSSGSLWPARWPWSRKFCCSTNPLARSMPRCVKSFAAGYVTCMTSSISPASLSPTTRRKRWSFPTVW